MKIGQPPKSLMRRLLNFIYVVIFLVFLVGLLEPSREGPRYVKQSAAMQTSRNIGLCLSQYAADHHGRYPDGKTSTEVFQQLIDQKYVIDPEIFYVRYITISGKVKPQDHHLKAENVCFDVTCCVDSSSPDDLPIVFLTGFKVNYQAGAKAIPTDPPDVDVKRTWSQWWNGTDDYHPKGIAVSDKGNSARWIKADENGSVPNFIPDDFDSKGKMYRQLTP
jgi:hypothetical protein